ncbi:MAG: 2OG-Fe(II) oxygenase [bacterium]|nr:2OG-Fe(II) oxygenase [bacterium]
MLNPELLTSNLCMHGFHVVDNFLELSHYQSLYQMAEKLNKQGLFRSAKIGLKIQAQQNKTIRSDEIFWLDEESKDESIQVFLKQINHIATQLNRTLFLGLSEFEAHFAVYQAGSFYKKHCDQFSSTKARKISCVYYLNKQWTNDFGGALKLYNTKDQLIQQVLPMGNRLICFDSELPHEVCLTYKTRYSIAGWMKTRALLPV